jgi:hypothetical protein
MKKIIMKKILFLFMFLSLLAIIFLLVTTQKPSITGCLGLTFGMSQNEAIHQLASKIDTTIPTISDTDEFRHLASKIDTTIYTISDTDEFHHFGIDIDTTRLTISGNETTIYFYDFYFADHHFDQISLGFYDGKLYKIMLVKKFIDEYKMESVFSNLKSSYEIKYNKPCTEDDSSIKWKDIYNNSIIIFCDTAKKRLLIVYEDDNIDKKLSLEKDL